MKVRFLKDDAADSQKNTRVGTVNQLTVSSTVKYPFQSPVSFSRLPFSHSSREFDFLTVFANVICNGLLNHAFPSDG